MKTLIVRCLMSAALLLNTGSDLEAQRRRGGQRQVPNYVENIPYNGDYSFTFARISFQPRVDMFGNPGDLKWDHDYPRAELNFAQILMATTMVRPYLGGSNIIAVGDPELYRYPVAYMSEPGFLTLTDEEAENLRNYIIKGGFLIFDDFAANQWRNFAEKTRALLPDAQLIRLDASHEIFDAFFRIESLEYQHPYYGLQSEFWGVYEDNDPSKRLLLVANYNNDIGEYWEFSGTGFLPIDLSNEAYKLGVNYLIYSMTH